jgi:hypothetical protein
MPLQIGLRPLSSIFGRGEYRPGLADEIFRVFAREYPEIEIVQINAAPAVQQMIALARSNWGNEIGGILRFYRVCPMRPHIWCMDCRSIQ